MSVSDSYCYQLLQELNKQRKGGILCDVNIVVSGEVFRAHKNILVAGSRYFKTLYCLTKSENASSTSSSSSSCFSVILDFLYSGNLLLTSQNAIEVMSVASYLQMTEVVGSCRGFIKEALNISIKQEAPDSVVVDYNKRRTVAKDGAGQVGSDGSTNKKPGSNFWATTWYEYGQPVLFKSSSDTALNKLKCPHCNYIAKHRRTLKRHLIIHSGVRSFSCDICGKLFTRRDLPPHPLRP
uniref:Zinc finger and BTB domain containing 10 n=1 Tax=Hucho hucho TaxID=62062 RepID=A0A4W5PDL1_9TELE